MRFFSSWPLATLLAGGLALLAPAAHAQHRPAPAGASPMSAGQPLREALTPAGTLRPGATGSFDATGYRMSTDPTTGSPAFRPAGAGDENWQDGFNLPGTNGQVTAMAVATNGDVYIGGGFTAVGAVVANRIAKWDGTTWSALGTGTNNFVNALAISGTDVYAGGSFTTAGAVAASRIAKWNGTAWSALGAGLNGSSSALAILGTDLYAGGSFTTAGAVAASNMAKWNGTAWSALGTGLNNSVYALAVSGTDVYAGGVFTTAGGSAANRVAKWNGTAWSALGTGISGTFGGTVQALAVSGVNVYAGGGFTQAGAGSASNVARWNGTTWSAMSSGANSTVQALAVIGTDLYMSGDFTTAGSSSASRIAKWNGTAWSAVGTGTNAYCQALAVSGTAVYAGGNFTTAGGLAANYVAKWNTTAWSALGTGFNTTIQAVAILGTDVYVGGNFIQAGGAAANRVAKWNGTTWSALGTGLNSTVRALAVSGTNLYVCGDFTTAGGAPANYVAKWNGTAWSALGAGLNGNSRALAVSGSDVYAGGGFTAAGGSAANYVAKWDGTTWSALGTGLNDVVFALAVSGPDVYVGGNFTAAGGRGANYVAKWNGTAWSALDGGCNSTVYALAVIGTDLYVGGDFFTINGMTANHIAKWNGAAWSTVGTGVNNTVYALAVSGTSLYVGGTFTAAGGAAAYRIVKWNGTAWSTLGTGLNNLVYGLAVGPGNKIYAGGGFTAVGDDSKRTVYFGIYNTPPNVAPTALGLSPQSVAENVAAGTIIGTFSTTDADAGDTFTYTLVSGAGSTHNGAFSINGSGQLVITASPDFETQASYAIRVRTTDAAGASFEQPFTISVTDLVEDLTVTTTQTVPGGTYTTITITGTGTATLTGPVQVSGAFTVETGGVLNTSCQPITGAGTFTLQAGAILGICDAAGITASAATGAVQVTGSRSFATDATYVYNGTAGQTTGDGLPTPVRELEIANGSDVTLTQAVAVTHVLRLTDGTLATGGQLTLLSDATRTAYAVHNGGLTSGKVTVQRYVGGPLAAGYRHLSSPVQGAPVSALTTAGFTPVVNPATNALPYVMPPAASFPTIYGFDETRGGTTPAYAGFATGYFSPTTLADVLTPGRGWSVLMPGAQTPDFVGNLTTGDLPVNLTVTGTNTSPNTQKAGWHLLGNLYPQPIDWDLASVPAGMSASISVYRTTGNNNGIYLTRANGLGNLPNGELPLGQGFFARATVNNTVFTFTNALRVEVNPATVARPVVDTRPVVRLTLQATTPDAVADETLIYAETGATLGEDLRFDGLRPGRNTGTVPTLASLIDGQEAAVNGLPLESLTAGNTTVELTAALPTASTYTLAVAELANLPATTTVALLDRKLNLTQPLTAGTTYQLTASAAGEVVASRFALVFNANRVTGTHSSFLIDHSSLIIHPNPVAAGGALRVTGAAVGSPLTLFDATGRSIATVTADATGAATVPVRGLVGGVYVLRASDGRTTRLVVE